MPTMKTSFRLPSSAFCVAVAASCIAHSALCIAAEPPPAAAQEGVQLWEGGPHWADRNVGADEPWEAGFYFWWGDILGSTREKGNWVASNNPSRRRGFEWFPESTPTYGKSADTLQSQGWTTADDVLAPEHDAARVQWGGEWRMPTSPELEALGEKCDWSWTTTNGMNGFVVRGRGDFAHASIFLPAAGWGTENKWWGQETSGTLWASDPRLDGPLSDYSWSIAFRFHKGRTEIEMVRRWNRYLGLSVRPVRGAPALPVRAPVPAAADEDGDRAVVATAPDGRTGVRLWEGGPFWADRNVGADEPWDSGLFFWWGEAVGYRREGDQWVLSDGSGTRMTFDLSKTNNVPTARKGVGELRNEGVLADVVMRSGAWTVTNSVLAPAHDPARAYWGGDWRMPTRQDLLDICYNKCDWIPATTNGVGGFVVRGRGDYAEASIFLPFTGWAIGSKWEFQDAGFLWASDPRGDMPASWRLKFSLMGKNDPRPRCCVGYHWDRLVTVPVRPVRGK